MALLSKAAILAVDDRRYEDVEVPEWGGTIRIMGLTGTERDAWEASRVRVGSQGNLQGVVLTDARASLLARCIVDGDGERLFSDKEIRDLGAKSSVVLDRLMVVARRLSGIGKEALEDAAGNSTAAPSGASTSG